MLKQSQNLSTVKKRWCYSQTVPKPANSQKKMVQYSNRAKTFNQSGKYGTILKQGQNLSPVRKRWYDTQTESKLVTSQKKMVQYLNSAKTCHLSEKDGTKRNIGKTCNQSEKDGTILKQSQNLSAV